MRVTRRTADPVRWRTAFTIFSGWRAIETIDATTISTSDGTRSACHSTRLAPLGRVRFEVDELREDVDTRRAVDRGVVDLGDDRGVAVLEALGHPQLPERTGPVELARRDVAHDLGELVGSTRSGNGARDGRGSRDRSPGSSTHSGWWSENGTVTSRRAEGDDLVDPFGHEAPERVGGEPTFDPRWVEDRRGHHVHVVRGGLELQERSIEAGQALHDLIMPPAHVGGSRSGRISA